MLKVSDTIAPSGIQDHSIGNDWEALAAHV